MNEPDGHSAAKPQPQWSVWLALTLARWLPKPATSQFPQKGRSLRDTWSPRRGNSDGANWSADIMVFGDRSWQFLARKAKTCVIVVQILEGKTEESGEDAGIRRGSGPAGEFHRFAQHRRGNRRKEG